MNSISSGTLISLPTSLQTSFQQACCCCCLNPHPKAPKSALRSLQPTQAIMICLSLRARPSLVAWNDGGAYPRNPRRMTVQNGLQLTTTDYCGVVLLHRGHRFDRHLDALNSPVCLNLSQYFSKEDGLSISVGGTGIQRPWYLSRWYPVCQCEHLGSNSLPGSPFKTPPFTSETCVTENTRTETANFPVGGDKFETMATYLGLGQRKPMPTTSRRRHDSPGSAPETA